METKGWLNRVLEEATKEVATWPKWMRASMESESGQVPASDTVARVLTLKDSPPNSKQKNEE